MGQPHVTFWMTAAAAMLTPASVQANAGETVSAVRMAQMVIERRVVIRVAPHAQRARNQEAFRDWREKSAPNCFQINTLAGIMISKPDSIDMVLRGGQLVRARLEKGCPSIDFYSGFYLKPTRDGRLCEDRDLIHSRTGGACEIDRFKTLVPPKRERSKPNKAFS